MNLSKVAGLASDGDVPYLMELWDKINDWVREVVQMEKNGQQIYEKGNIVTYYSALY